MSTDRIEKQLLLRAPRPRVWRALTDAGEFGQWFGLKLEGAFAAGQRTSGRITTPGYDHLNIALEVERIEPERLFSYRWHPYAIDTKLDYTAEPTTLVEFVLAEVQGGTQLTLTESGFDRIPLARRAEAFRMNERGWGEQLRNIERHVAG